MVKVNRTMFLRLNHQKMDLYQLSIIFVLEYYKLTKQFPSEERFSMTAQIRRAALSVHLNIFEGASRKSSAERRRFYEIARGSLVEVDAALDIAEQLSYLINYKMLELENALVRCFKIFLGLIAPSDPPFHH